MTAPATGRTADENEMRAQVRKAIVAAMPENIPLRGRMARSIMAAVINPLLSEAAHLRAENANLRDRMREAEGAAEALPDMLRKCRFQSAVIDTLSEEIGNARRMTNGWAKGTLLLLPFVDMAAGEGLEWAEQDDGSPRMDAADLCAAFAKAMGLEIGDAAYMAMIAEGRDAIRALSPEPQEAGDHEPR